MTEHHVRPLAESELREAHELFYRSIHRSPLDEQQWNHLSAERDHTRRLGAFAHDELVGTATSLPSALGVPGAGVVPAAAVTAVGVRADRTRRGALTALMEAQLAAVRAAGEPVAVLHSSEARIYGRFGYGIASRDRAVTMSRYRAAFRPEAPRGGTVRLIEFDEAVRVLPTVYERIGLRRPGMIARGEAWWRVFPALQPGSFVVHTDANGVDDGFAQYEVRTDGYRGDDRNTLRVMDLQAANADAAAGLWRFLTDVDLVDEVVAFGRPLDEPLEWWLEDPRGCRVTGISDELWVRLVDVPTALDARSFGGTGEILVEVRDPLLPENSGTYAIGPRGASRSDRTAQLVMGVDMLAALYLGDVSVSTLAASNRVEVRDRPAVAIADEVFRTKMPPWCGTRF